MQKDAKKAHAFCKNLEKQKKALLQLFSNQPKHIDETSETKSNTDAMTPSLCD